MQSLYTGASVKSILTNCFHAVGHNKRHQTDAIRKGIVINKRNRFGEMYSRDFGTTRKCVFTYCFHRVSAESFGNGHIALVI